MQNKTVRAVNIALTALFVAALVILIMTFSIGLPIYCRFFYYIQINTLNLEEASGHTYAEIKAAYDEILDYLAEHGVLHKVSEADGGRYYWQDDSYPASGLSLRSATSENYTITDITIPQKPKVIGTMDRRSAPTLIFPDAIYFHGGRSYIVESLDTEKMQCFIREIDAEYYTDGDAALRINITDDFETQGNYGWGEVLVTETPTIFKKIKLATHENAGFGQINLPEEQMHTTACWIMMPESRSRILSCSSSESVAIYFVARFTTNERLSIDFWYLVASSTICSVSEVF